MMEDAIKVLSVKFNLSQELLQNIGNDSAHISNWLNVLGKYVLDNEKIKEDHLSKESILRKERLNAEYQLSQLDKQLISCNTKLSKYEQTIMEIKLKLEKAEETLSVYEKKLTDAINEKSNLISQAEQYRQQYKRLEQEKSDFAEILEKKNSEIDRINEEWSDMSNKLSEANKVRYRLQYDLDEIKNSDIRKEFKEKRLEQEKSMLLQQLEDMTNELKLKSELLIQAQRDQTSKFIDIESKYEISNQENVQLRSNLEIYKDTCAEQEKKLKLLMSKLEQISEENVELQHNMQQELSSQTKLVELYKDDRDHAKNKLSEISAAFSELQAFVLQVNKEKSILAENLKESEKVKESTIETLTNKIKEQCMELENANRLLEISKKKDGHVKSEDLSSISPMAAATSAILKKGMTLTQIYTEYVKVSDQLAAEKEENSRLKIYMEQILREVEEKAPMLLQQKEDYDYATKTIESLSLKLEQNIKECHHHQNQLIDYERKFEFHRREEKRLHNLAVDLSQQVCVLLKEVEEARGGVVSSSIDLPELLSNDNMVSSSCQVISDHLVTFKSIEELQSQNKRLLVTVRELSEEQEKLELEGGTELIQELKKKFANARDDLNALKENEKTQQEMMQQIIRQRDMYKLLCQAGNTMVGEVSSTSSSLAAIDVETELNKVRTELDCCINEHLKFKEEASIKEMSLNSTIEKHLEELSVLRMEHERIKNQLGFSNEKYSILMTTAEGYKKEIKALEEKCQSITNSLSKYRIETESSKQSYNEMREKLITAEVSLKSLSTEKYLIQEAEKRLMQENQSLLDQQRSQNVLLANLQTIQNNLEKQEFDTRTSLGKQCEALQREMKVIRRNFDNEGHQLKSTVLLLENEIKDLKVKLGVEIEIQNKTLKELEMTKQQLNQSEAKCKELESLTKASDNRLAVVLQRESTGRENEESHREIELLKMKLRELELTLSNTVTEKKTLEEQLITSKKHLEQYKEIGDSNEHAITTLTQLKDSIEADLQMKIKVANDTIENSKKQIEILIAEKTQLKKTLSEADKTHQYQLSELRNQMAPLERRFQEVTRALVNAKELEESAVKEAQAQASIAKEAQDKYERELILHAKDVEQFTLLKEEVQFHKNHHDDLKVKISEVNRTLDNNNKLMDQMKHHHQIELRKGETARKDLIDENAILHSQVEKLSAQLANAKSQNITHQEPFTSSDKSIEEVYELLRREKEIAETKAEACKTESMRFRQRAEHLQRDIDETKAALELEMKRTQGRMLSEEEYKGVMEKVNKIAEFEVLNQELERNKLTLMTKNEQLQEQNRKLEAEMKPLAESKKTLEGEKNLWLAEKTALKSEIERWTSRTNQIMMQSTKSDNEELKKLQMLKTQNEKVTAALQEDLKKIKQQFDTFKRETLKSKNESQEKISGLESDLTVTRNKLNAALTTALPTKPVEVEQLSTLQKELDQLKSKNTEMTEKSKMVRKVARKYKTISDQLQKLLKENNIDFSSIINVSSNTGQPNDLDASSSNQAVDQEEKKKYEMQIAEKTKDLSKELTFLQSQLAAECKRSNELEKKMEEFKSYLEEEKKLSEKKLSEKNKELEALKVELADGKKKLTEVQEKNKKLLKTCKDKLYSLTKLKDSSNREIESLKDQLEKSRVEQQDILNEGTLTSVHTLEEKLLASTVQVNELVAEKTQLIQRLDELQKQVDKMCTDLEIVENKTASQKKSRIISKSKPPSEQQPSDTICTGIAPLTATVRPTATPSQVTSKFHSQSTPTASIRPLAYGHPTAMISPTVPATQASLQTPIASVSALPVPLVFLPHVAELQGRASYSRHLSERQSFITPVARVSVQVRAEDTNDDIPTTDEAVATSSSSFVKDSFGNKRNHQLTQSESDETIEVLDEDDSIEPGSKRQRVDLNVQEQQLDTESHDVEEDDLLSEENVEEEAVEEDSADCQISSYKEVTQSTLHGTQLQTERQFQPSPQELLRQRQNMRGRSQLPSFSLISSQGNSVSFFEETDDSMVPSTPTLYMPKRMDGFAEAISSPTVRFSSFSHHSSVPHTEFSEARLSDDSANVPLTPLSVVPNVNIQHPLSARFQLPAHQEDINKFFGEDSNLQHVPQQVDLTEEEDINEQESKVDAELVPAVQVNIYASKDYLKSTTNILHESSANILHPNTTDILHPNTTDILHENSKTFQSSEKSMDLVHIHEKEIKDLNLMEEEKFGECEPQENITLQSSTQRLSQSSQNSSDFIEAEIKEDKNQEAVEDDAKLKDKYFDEDILEMILETKSQNISETYDVSSEIDDEGEDDDADDDDDIDESQIKEQHEVALKNDEIPKIEPGDKDLEEIIERNEEDEETSIDAIKIESDDDISRDATESKQTELPETSSVWKDEHHKKAEDEKTKPVRLQRGVRPRLRRDLPLRLAKASDSADKPG